MLDTKTMIGDPICATGYRQGNGRWDINLCSVWTKLIQEAGQICEHYASDLLIEVDSIKKLLESGKDIDEEFLFGFRDCGVDHKEWVKIKLDNPEIYREVYGSIWCMTIKSYEDRLDVRLFCIYKKETTDT